MSRRRARLVVALLLATCTALTACIGESELVIAPADPPPSSTDPDGGPAADPPIPGVVTAHLDELKSAVLELEDLGADWVEVEPPQVFKPDGHWCGASDDLPDRILAYQRHFAFELRDGRETATLIDVAIAAASEAAAEAEFAVVGGDAYLSCMTKSIQAGVARLQAPVSDGPFETLVDEVELQLQFPVPVRLHRFITTFPVGDATGWTRNDLIRMRTGTVLHRIQYVSYDGPVDVEVLEEIVAAVVARTT